MLDTPTSQMLETQTSEITPEMAAYFNKQAGRVYEGFVFGGIVDNWAIPSEKAPRTSPQYSPLFLVPTDCRTRFRVVADAFTYADNAMLKNNGEVVTDATALLRGETIKYASGSLALPSESQIKHLRDIVAHEKQALNASTELNTEVPVLQEESPPVKTSFLSRVMSRFAPAQPQAPVAVVPSKPVELTQGFAGLRITWQDYYATSMVMKKVTKKGNNEPQDHAYLAQLGGVNGSWESIEINRVRTGASREATNLPWLQSFNVRLVAEQKLALQLFNGMKNTPA